MRCRSTTARRSCSRRPSCCPGRGARGSTPRRCSGQSKTCYQAEIDSACELIDFWRINVHFARQILAEQPPLNSKGIWNRTDYRPLEGFVYAITPFNFTAIAGNLPTAPALMGNTVVWKPSPTQNLAAQLTMELLEEAGMPPGVINMVTGDGLNVSKVALRRPGPGRHPLHRVDADVPAPVAEVGANLTSYRTYPRLVGETGGKDFVLAHPSADPDVLRTALIRGAFEYQGQKCSAASRAYVPASLWKVIRDDLVDITNGLPQGDVTDFSNFMGAVIDERAFAKNAAAIDRAKAAAKVKVIAGGTYDDSVGWFVRPTVVEVDDRPTSRSAPSTSARSSRSTSSRTPVRRDAGPDGVVRALRLTGSIIAQDRPAIADGHGTSAVRGRQLLHQRQADRRRRGAAAVRRRSRVGDQRQGRRRPEPVAVDQCPLDQGDLRPRDVARLPAHGLSVHPGSGGEPASARALGYTSIGEVGARGALAPLATLDGQAPFGLSRRVALIPPASRLRRGFGACLTGARDHALAQPHGSGGQPGGADLLLLLDGAEDGALGRLLDLAAEQRDLGLEVTVEVDARAEPAGREAHLAVHRDRRVADGDGDGPGPRPVGGRAAPDERLGHAELRPDHRLREVRKLLGRRSPGS